MEPNDVKKILVAGMNPSMNNPNREIKWLYENDDEQKMTIIVDLGLYTKGNAIVGCRLEQHDEKFDGVALLLCEYRMGIPIIEAGFKITDGKVILEPIDPVCFFPIDEEDEAEAIKFLTKVASEADLDKVYYDDTYANEPERPKV